MTLYNTVAYHVLGPAYDLVRGTNAMRHLSGLEKSQWWSHEQVEELQSLRLRGLIEHAYSRVPYYHRVIAERDLVPSDIRTASDLSKLPTLTKVDIRTAGDGLIAGDFDRRQLRRMRTSGSTVSHSSSTEPGMIRLHSRWHGFCVHSTGREYGLVIVMACCGRSRSISMVAQSWHAGLQIEYGGLSDCSTGHSPRKR
ncbi:MAG: hypothetical protein ACOC9B_00855 [Chloroflexota bacterium]